MQPSPERSRQHETVLLDMPETACQQPGPAQMLQSAEQHAVVQAALRRLPMADRSVLLGDNRLDSTDSRSFGTVPMQDILGRARQVWFSSDKQGVRWSRLGQVLE